MKYECAVHELPETHVLSIRDQVAMDGIPGFVGEAFGELYGSTGGAGIEATGHPFVLYHAFGPDGVDAEVCVPVPPTVPAAGRMTHRDVPAATVVRTLHIGPYEGIGAAYEAVQQWVGDHGYTAAGAFRERYLNGPGMGISEDDYRTEIDVPVEEAAVGAAR